MSLMENLVPKATLVGPEDNVNESETDIDALFDSIIAEAGLTTEGPEVNDEPAGTTAPENSTPVTDVTEGDGEEIVDDVTTAVDDATDVNDDDVDDLEGEDDFDPDDLSDEELAALDRELTNGELDDVANTDGEAEVTLSPEEEIDADDMMNLAATTMLVKDELSVDERVAFLKNTDEINTAINEGFLTDADVTEMAMELDMLKDDVVTEAKYNNRMIIKLDAASKKKQLYALAVNVSAAAHNDRDYIKLKKVMKMRKILRAKLAKKYHGEATKRMKIYFKRLNASKSSTLNSIGNRNK